MTQMKVKASSARQDPNLDRDRLKMNGHAVFARRKTIPSEHLAFAATKKRQKKIC